VRQAAKELGVRYVLEGSVRRAGNRLRITAQLINVEDGFHFWSEKYDREMDDIFAIQDEIALAITEQLKITLIQKDLDLITKTFTKNAEAYELYLKGRFHVNRRGRSILAGLQFLKQAIEADPDFALAYAGYADANILAAAYSFCPGRAIMQSTKLPRRRPPSVYSRAAVVASSARNGTGGSRIRPPARRGRAPPAPSSSARSPAATANPPVTTPCKPPSS
jgi:hypothetical protein